jgi:hypothetical protein
LNVGERNFFASSPPEIHKNQWYEPQGKPWTF